MATTFDPDTEEFLSALKEGSSVRSTSNQIFYLLTTYYIAKKLFVTVE